MGAGHKLARVLVEGRLVGILSERDVVTRVVVPQRDPGKTLVSEIMTSDVRTAGVGTSTESAMTMMDSGRFRHLPVLDDAGKVAGILSMRHLLRDRVDELDRSSQRSL